MKNLYSYLNTTYKLILTKVCVVSLMFVSCCFSQLLYAQWCFPGSASTSTGSSVDPPLFVIVPPSGSGCSYMDFGYRPIELCPISPQPWPNIFASVNPGVTCLLLSNSSWNNFAVNVQYCWGTHTQGAGLTWQGGGNIMRLQPSLPITGQLLPSNGTAGSVLTPLMKWQLVEGAESYRLCIYTDPCAINRIFDANFAADSTRISPGVLYYNSSYYWHVKPYGQLGEGPFADLFSFTTANPSLPPVAPLLYSPADGSHLTTFAPVLDWDSLNNATGFQIQISTNQSFTSSILDTTAVVPTFLTVRPNLLGTDITYYWRVKASNTFGSSPWSSIWNFRIPGVPVWNVMPTNTSSSLFSVRFIDTSIGFACGSGGTVIKSTNGGASWSALNSGVTGWLCDIFFLNKDTGWFVGEGGCVRNTTDGGLTWGVQSPQFSSFINTVHFINSSTGFLGCTSGGAFRTSNGGVNWNYMGISPGYAWQEFSFPPDGAGMIGYLGGENLESGGVMKTTDGGTTWFQVSPRPGPSSWGISFFNSSTGFTSGPNGYIGYTSNAGLNWVSQNSGATSYLFDITQVNSRSAWAVGSGGKIIYTNDNGVFWQENISNTTADLRKVSFAGLNTGWACGSNGTIVKTTNGGSTTIEPILLSPINGAVSQLLTPTLDWSFVNNASKYRVQLSLNQDFNTLVLDDSNITESEFNVPSGYLDYFTYYYWRVAAKQPASWSSFSSVSGFRTFGLPQQVVLVYPTNNSTEQPLNFTFVWNKALQTIKIQNSAGLWKLHGVDNTEKLTFPDAINKYWFELTSDTISLVDLLRDSTITDTLKYISGLSTGKKYFWRVKAKNEIGWGIFTGWNNFTTTYGPPQMTLLSYPADVSAVFPGNVEFRWFKTLDFSTVTKSSSFPVDHKTIEGKHTTLSSSVTAYCLELTYDTSSMAGLYRDTTIIDTTKIVSISANSTKHYWRVKAKNAYGWGAFSRWWSFLSLYSQTDWSMQKDYDSPYFTSISFVNPYTGWASGAAYYNAEVHKTTNGGENWFEIADVYEVKAISFMNQNSGCAVVNYYPEYNVTNNGGIGWSNINLLFFYQGGFSSCAMNSSGAWVCGLMNTQNPAVGTKSIILRNGGEVLRDNDAVPLNRIRSTANEIVWCVGGNRLYKYQNGSFIEYTLSGNFTGISFPDTLNGFVVGGPDAYRTSNGGINWVRFTPLDPAGSYSDVSFVNKDTGWIAADIYNYSGILSTTNGGLNWSVQYAGGHSYQPYELSFVNPKLGWAVFYGRVVKFGNSLSAPLLTSPANGSTGQTLTPVLDWESSSGALKYRLQLSGDSAFSSILIEDSSLTQTEYTVPSGILQNFTIYYWRVAASDNNTWSNFSALFSFRTFGIPNNVVLSYPPNNASGVGTSLTFNWFTALPTKKTDKQNVSENDKSLRDAAGKLSIGNYWFEMTRDTVNLTDLITDTLLTDTSKAVSGLIFSNSYYWRVKAKNEAGWGAFSPWWKFTTTNGAPVLQQPVNNQTEVQVTPLLNWSDVAGALKYRVQVSAFSNFSVLWLDDSSSTASQFQVPNGILAYNSLYYWRVKTRNTAGWGDYQTPIRFFTQVVPPPPVPALSAPSNGATGVELTPLLNWNDVTGSTKYRVQVSLASDFSTTLIDDSGIVASEYQISSGILNSNTLYFWRAAVKGSSSWSSFSSPWSFTTIGVPQPVVLFSPLNNASAQELNINFIWYKASELVSGVLLNAKDNNPAFKKTNSAKISLQGADAINGYRFEITADTVTFAGLIVDSTLTDTAKFVSGLTANTSYYWRVKAKNEIGWGAYSLWWKFTTLNNVPPAAPVLISPANSAINISVTPLLDWSDVSGSEKYRVQVSAFSNFSVLWIDDSSSVSSQFRVPNGVLAYNSAYFWRVKAKNNAGWGEYQVSPFRFFTLITPPPSAPVLLLPANGATGVLLNPMLDWNNVSGALKYRLQVSSMPDFSTLLIDDSSLTNSEFNVTAGILGSSSTYYWKAAAKDNTAWGDFSATWNFTTLGLPQPVVLTYPQNNAVEQPLNITFNWNKAAELLNKLTKSHDKNNNGSKIFVKSFIDGPSAINAYWFEMTTDTLSMTGLVRDTLLTDTLKNVSGLSSNTTYFWRVKAGNELGWGPFSGWWKFTTSSGLPPAPPVQIYPLNNAQNITVTPQLDWSDISGAQKYRLQVSALSNFSVLWIDDSSLTSSSYQVNNGVLAYNSVYYWRIKAKNISGWGNYQTSPYRFFTMIIPPPAVPVLLTPANGATGVNLTPLLDWNDVSGSVKYRILLAADSGFTNILADDSTMSVSQYSVPAALLANSTEYYWKAAAKNSMYWGSFSGKYRFKTYGSPQIVILLSPANNLTEQPLNITFTWMKAMESLKKSGDESKLKAGFTGSLLFGEKSGADAISKYWFELVTDTVSMAGLINDTTLTDTVKSLTGLTAMTNYYWRVKAFNDVGWGPFSMWWKFTTVSGLPPAAPVLIYPANRESDISVTPLLNWSDVPGAQKYYLQVSALSNFSVLWVNDSSITLSEYQVPNGVLAYNSGYYWRVKARNDAGWGNFQATPFRFFTLVTPPQAPPALISPANGSVNIPLTPLLDWSDITSALKYRLQVSAVNTFVTTIVDDSGLTASQYNVTSGLLSYNTGYYWRVSVKTGTSWSAFSNAWSFTTVTALGSPVLQQPLNKDTGVAVTTLFKWSNVAGATSYRLQVSAFSNFSVLWIDKYVTDTAYQTPNGVLAYNSRYFWKVKSLRAGDSSSFSNPNYFFTKIFPYTVDMPEFESTRILDLSGLISTDTKASYSIEFCKDTLFNQLASKLNDVKSEKIALSLEAFDEYSTYFWRVCLNGPKPVYSEIRVLETYITKHTQLMSLRTGSQIPDKYALYQNYPNPFNPVCRIRFDIPENGKSKTEFAKLVIYDLIGREIAVLVNGNLEAGTYEVNWNAEEMPSGIYIYRIKTASFTDTKKMVLLK